jgi:23S rRNA pseudouridine2604 synthase
MMGSEPPGAGGRPFWRVAGWREGQLRPGPAGARALGSAPRPVPSGKRGMGGKLVAARNGGLRARAVGMAAITLSNRTPVYGPEARRSVSRRPQRPSIAGGAMAAAHAALAALLTLLACRPMGAAALQVRGAAARRPGRRRARAERDGARRADPGGPAARGAPGAPAPAPRPRRTVAAGPRAWGPCATGTRLQWRARPARAPCAVLGSSRLPPNPRRRSALPFRARSRRTASASSAGRARRTSRAAPAPPATSGARAAPARRPSRRRAGAASRRGAAARLPSPRRS